MPTVPSMVSQQLGLLSSGADPADVREGQSFIKPGSLAIQSGTMTDNGNLGTIIPGTTDTTIPEGYTSGGVVQGDPDLLPTNIKAGTDIFGVTGTAVLATGSAVDANVLFGVTYSSSSGAGTGTMPNNGSLGMIIPDTTSKTIPAGYTTGGTVAGSANLIPSNIRSGTSIYGVAGSVIPASGSATADKLLLGETASTAAGLITGTMPNNGSLGTITPGTTSTPIPSGYTSGGSVAGSGNLQPGNIRLGVNIFGITGSLDPGTQTGGTANPEDVLTGETFTNDSGVQTGNMLNNGAVNITPGSTSQTIPIGYHNGGGTVGAVTFDTTKVLTGTTIAGTAGTMVNNGDLGTITPGIDTQSIPAGYTSGGTVAGDIDLVPGNIKSGVNIFGVTGTLSNTVITGQTQQPVAYAETLATNDAIYTVPQIGTPVSLPTNPPGYSTSVTYSQDGNYMVAGLYAAPFIIIYKINNGVYTKLPDPSVLPSSTAYGVAFSPDGVHLAVAQGSTPFLSIYKRSGDTFTRLANPSSLPTGSARSVAFSPDGVHLVVAHDTTPFVTIYKRSGDTFTKLTNPSTLPTGLGTCVTFSSDGVFLGVSHWVSPFVTIYKRSGDTFTKLANPTTLPTGIGNSVCFNFDTTLFVVTQNDLPAALVYSISADTFTKLPNLPNLPSSSMYTSSFSKDGRMLVIGMASSPYLLIYKIVNMVFSRMSDLPTMPANTVTGSVFSPDGKYLGISSTTAPFAISYQLTDLAYKSANKISEALNAKSLGYVLENGIAGDTKDAILIWR